MKEFIKFERVKKKISVRIVDRDNDYGNIDYQLSLTPKQRLQHLYKLQRQWAIRKYGYVPKFNKTLRIVDMKTGELISVK